MLLEPGIAAYDVFSVYKAFLPRIRFLGRHGKQYDGRDPFRVSLPLF